MAATISTAMSGPPACPITSRSPSAERAGEGVTAMAVNYKVEWPMNLGAPGDSLEAKQPPVDDGLDVPDPTRYYTRDFMELEWRRLWPRVWLLAGVASDIPEEGDYFVFELGR